MKKTLSVLLAVLMLLATFAVGFAVFADDAVACPYCNNPHSATPDSCTCCLRCPNIDLTKVAACAKDGSRVVADESGFCCGNCTGWFNCTCGQSCGCEFCAGTGSPKDSEMDPIIPEQTQDYIKNLFQNIIHKISEVFDRIFEVAFAIFNVK